MLRRHAHDARNAMLADRPCPASRSRPGLNLRWTCRQPRNPGWC